MSGAYEHRVLIGACGWRHAAWAGSFYPEDLPEDWQLAYYANAYRTVLIPGGYWAQGAAQDWAEEVPQGFRFVAEAPQEATAAAGAGHPAAARAWVAGLAGLGDACAAVLVRPDRGVCGAATERLAAAFAGGPPLVLDLPAEDPGAPGAVRVWHGPPEPVRATGPVFVARVEGAPEPRALRAIVQSCLDAAADGRRSLLLFDGDPPSVPTLDAAGVILDLL